MLVLVTTVTCVTNYYLWTTFNYGYRDPVTWIFHFARCVRFAMMVRHYTTMDTLC